MAKSSFSSRCSFRTNTSIAGSSDRQWQRGITRKFLAEQTFVESRPFADTFLYLLGSCQVYDGSFGILRYRTNIGATTKRRRGKPAGIRKTLVQASLDVCKHQRRRLLLSHLSSRVQRTSCNRNTRIRQNQCGCSNRKLPTRLSHRMSAGMVPKVHDVSMLSNRSP